MIFGTFVNPKQDPREDQKFIIGFADYEHLWKKQLVGSINVRAERLKDHSINLEAQI